MEKMMTSSLPEEEEEVFACLSFRNLAVGSNLRSSSSPTSSSSSSDGDLEFEFLPSADNRASFFYPIFSGIGDTKGGEEIPESKVKVEEEEEEEITPWKTNCLWSTEKKRGKRREGIIEKCRSTGSGSPRPWRLRDLVVIGRSRSDGNEKLLLQSPTRTTTNKKDGREDRRRTTFLPYRSEVVSLFPARRILPRRKSHY